MDNQKACLYDVEWQSLRVSLLSQNRKDSGFGSIEGTTANLDTLLKYLQSTSNDKETLYRSWRILNLLNATRMGFSGTGLKGSQQDQLVVDFRERFISSLFTSLKHIGFSSWDWEKVEKDLINLYTSKREVFNSILKNLSMRKKNAQKRKAFNRPELLKFLGLMYSVQNKEMFL